MNALKVGSKAPRFVLPDQSGVERSLKDLNGEYVVLYFYPKDDTPGCTLEAQEFSKHLAAFKKLGAQVVGVSGGNVRSKEKFCSKYGLNITLLADEDFSVSKQFGVYGKKKFMGREYMGISRQTFVLDRAGKVIHAFSEVSPQGHAEEVLTVLRAGGVGSGTVGVMTTKKKAPSKKPTAKKPAAKKPAAKKPVIVRGRSTKTATKARPKKLTAKTGLQSKRSTATR